MHIGIKIAVDSLAVIVFYFLLKKKVDFLGIKSVWAISIPLLITLVVSAHLNMWGLALLVASALVVFPILIVVAYPERFRKFIDDYKKRTVSVSNLDKILDKDSQNTLVEAVADLSRRRIGSSIVIAREDALLDVEKTGISVGEVAITKEIISLLTLPQKPYSKGAILIRDNKIVAVNCKMPMLKNEQVANAGGGNRHFGMLGTVNKHDSIVIGSSGTTGGITLGGRTKDNKISFNLMVDLKEFNLQNGVTTDVLKERLYVLTVGKGDSETDVRDIQKYRDNPPEDPKKKRKERKERPKRSRD